MYNKITILAGPTASGKSALALECCRKEGGVIINADSKQVYREIPIITAQPSLAEQQEIPHMLYGNISVRENCSVAMWLDMVHKAIKEVLASGQKPLLVGGTGMYIRALMEGIAQIPDIEDEIRQKVREEGVDSAYKTLQEKDPETASRLKPRDTQRILRAYEVLLQTGKSISWWQGQKQEPLFPKEMFKLLFLLPDKQTTYENCNRRFVQMVENGLLDEIKQLDAMRIDKSLPAMKAHGVPELLAYLHGEMSLDEAILKAQQNTRNYIKRQFTWFRHQMKGAEIV